MGNVWGLFVGFLESVLLTFYQWGLELGLPGSAGIAIIIFTILARLVILPLTIKSIQSTRKMQELQPQIKELQRKYGKDPQKLQEETMKLYREYKINPVGGCFPMLLQFPIFIGVYQAVIALAQVPPSEHAVDAMIKVLASTGTNVTQLQQFSQGKLDGGFLWLSDLGKVDPYYILPILSVVFQLIVQLMATPRVQDPQQKAMAQSMLVLPIMFGYIGFTFPSGAVLYWVVGSILSMIQQYIISGWGSLANYLKFLPTDTGLFPPATPPIGATAGATGSPSPAPVEQSTERASFWDVLRPLVEQDAGDASLPESDSATEHAIERVRRQAGQVNPRRRRARR